MSISERIYYALATDFGRTFADHIIAFPDEWYLSTGGYRVVKSDGSVSVWVANRAYGLHVEIGENRESEIHPKFFDRRLLWAATRAARRKQGEDLRNQALALLHTNKQKEPAQ